MKELLIMRVKLFIEQSNTNYIKYSHDAGHSYSYIEHPLIEDVEEYPELEELLDSWLYENDECPPCQIHVFKDGTVTSSCGCHDHYDPVQENEELSDLLHGMTLEQRKTNNSYLITAD